MGRSGGSNMKIISLTNTKHNYTAWYLGFYPETGRSLLAPAEVECWGLADDGTCRPMVSSVEGRPWQYLVAAELAEEDNQVYVGWLACNSDDPDSDSLDDIDFAMSLVKANLGRVVEKLAV